VSSYTDVIIIGAGAAGLAAAKELARYGIGFSLVEGSHRIGGRAYSEEIAPGVWFDLGCSYLHQGEINAFAEIADARGIKIGREQGDLFDPERMFLYKNGVALTADERGRYFEYFDRCVGAAATVAESGKDAAMAEVIDLENEYALSFAHFMAELNAVDLDQTSCVDFISAVSGSDYPVANGYGNLVAAWGADVPVILNQRVERIDWAGKEARVITTGGEQRARAVLCTVSTGILGAGDIEFSPALPEWKMDAIAAVPIGIENKICLHFDRDVFGTDRRGFHITWNDAGQACGFEASVMGQNTAVVFTGGRFGVWLEKQGPQAGHEFALDRVAEAFGNDIRKHVTRSIVTAWATEPWTRGSYSAALPGQAHQREKLAQAVHDQLFFAGEASSVGDHACCHGAYRSGIRAAREIAAALQ